MTTADNIRNSIIDKLLTISDEEYLSLLYDQIKRSSIETDVVKLSESQLLMLALSDQDILNNRIISQEELDKQDLQWLDGQ